MQIICLVGRFALHSLCGVLLFALVSLVALFFHWFGLWINDYGVNGYVAEAIQSLEFFVLALDFLLFVLFMLREAVHLARAMMVLEPLVASSGE